MSFGGYNPNAPPELPIARSRTSSISSVHSQPPQQQQQQSQPQTPQQPQQQQQQQYPSSPYGTPYGSQPGTPGGHPPVIGDGGYFSPGISSGGYGGAGSGVSTPVSAPSSYCPTPPIPNQQHQHAGYMPVGQVGSTGGDQSGYSSGYESPAPTATTLAPTTTTATTTTTAAAAHAVVPSPSSNTTTTTAFSYGSRSHHRRLHSRNSSQGSLTIDTSFATGGNINSNGHSGSGGNSSSNYSPGPASLTSSASSSRRNSVSSDYGGGVFLRKGGGGSGIGFRPDESEIMIGNLMDGPNGNEGVQKSSGNNSKRSTSTSSSSKKVKRRSRSGPQQHLLHPQHLQNPLLHLHHQQQHHHHQHHHHHNPLHPSTMAHGPNASTTTSGMGRIRGTLGRLGVPNDWDMLLPTSDGYNDGEDDDDDYDSNDDDGEDEDESGMNADERWKKRQLRKRGWESTRGQAIIVCVLVVVAIFVRIWKLAVPGAVVFDEQHFGGFTVDYMRGEFFLDVHPPLGKMLFALVAYLLGFDGNFSFILGKYVMF
ncbi:hypothetical protein DFQ26_008797 [Actinomortierella ambigua]|nr:hypothetical protein DFQ26_008797 [Actinomortierella ambigua]